MGLPIPPHTLGDILIRLAILSLEVLRSPLGLTILGLLILRVAFYRLRGKPVPMLFTATRHAAVIATTLTTIVNNGGTNDLLQFRISDWNENFLRVCCTGTYRQLECAGLIPVDRQTRERIQMHTG
ncbi:hypothetical protein EKD04_002385 [Chloroflexales bacterium ZM16-3]|nr:hypothetical protein [Chloroflexales bacterium ZM16-3]